MSARAIAIRTAEEQAMEDRARGLLQGGISYMVPSDAIVESLCEGAIVRMQNKSIESEDGVFYEEYRPQHWDGALSIIRDLQRRGVPVEYDNEEAY